jgi:hypothetical protein
MQHLLRQKQKISAYLFALSFEWPAKGSLATIHMCRDANIQRCLMLGKGNSGLANVPNILVFLQISVLAVYNLGRNLFQYENTSLCFCLKSIISRRKFLSFSSAARKSFTKHTNRFGAFLRLDCFLNSDARAKESVQLRAFKLHVVSRHIGQTAFPVRNHVQIHLT